MLRRRQNRLKKYNTEDICDDKRRFTYDFNSGADNFTNKDLKKYNNDKDIAQGAVVNPVYEPGGAMIDNHTYQVSNIIQL